MVVTDPDTGKSFESTIEVNEPLRFKGMTVYQSSFDDGGSTVARLSARGRRDLTVDGTVGKTTEVSARPRAVRAAWAWRSPRCARSTSRTDARRPQGRQPELAEHVASVAGSAAGKKNENLRNVGPSVEYKLIDDAGQAHEFQNYMLPVELDGATVFLAGVRNNASESFRYLRIPADDDSSVAEFMRLRATLADPAARQEAARRFAERNSPTEPLQTAAERALETFAGGGLQAVAAFLQANTPPADLERAADVVIRRSAPA